MEQEKTLETEAPAAPARPRRRRQSSPAGTGVKVRRGSATARSTSAQQHGYGAHAGEEILPDATFELDVDMMVHDFDDERTLEEEEELAKTESEDPNAELSTLQMESEMPLDEVLKMYNCQFSRSGSEATSDAPSEEDEEEDEEEETPSALRKLYPEIPDSAEGGARKDCDEDEESVGDDDDAAQKDFLLGHCQIVMVGSNWQATIPEGLTPYDEENPPGEDKLLWDPTPVTADDVEGFLQRAADAEKSQRQSHAAGDANGMELAALPRGSHLRDSEGALYSLLRAKYNPDEALQQLQTSVAPTPSRPWTEDECRLFEEGIRTHGKVFRSIHEDFLPHRRVAELIEFYYLWKKTERHDVFANVERLQKKKYKLNPGVPDFREESPGATSLIQFDSKRQLPRRQATLLGMRDEMEPTEGRSGEDPGEDVKVETN
ncbi:mesoderm induction early response protein 1 [Lutzomyia longipalpis]|uniref:mesoderm induction early response protein 1 n=1 Tax=Lutzomyia longipalpis TaxID=7200 RepID=UPI0024843D03|nr:mesoderm induction early response protein 1 [Lutzomyia longipalpis]